MKEQSKYKKMRFDENDKKDARRIFSLLNLYSF